MADKTDNEPIEMIRKDELVSRLCILVGRVGRDVFKNKYPHGCFCAEHGPAEVSDIIVSFVEQAIADAIANVLAAALDEAR